jgi:hypothetical protein
MPAGKAGKETGGLAGQGYQTQLSQHAIIRPLLEYFKYYLKFMERAKTSAKKR